MNWFKIQLIRIEFNPIGFIMTTNRNQGEHSQFVCIYIQNTWVGIFSNVGWNADLNTKHTVEVYRQVKHEILTSCWRLIVKIGPKLVQMSILMVYWLAQVTGCFEIYYSYHLEAMSRKRQIILTISVRIGTLQILKRAFWLRLTSVRWSTWVFSKYNYIENTILFVNQTNFHLLNWQASYRPLGLDCSPFSIINFGKETKKKNFPFSSMYIYIYIYMKFNFMNCSIGCCRTGDWYKIRNKLDNFEPLWPITEVGGRL